MSRSGACHSRKITITGQLGSGKTVIAKMLAERSRLQFYSTGNIQREIAQKRGLTTLELNLESEKNRETDDLIDQFSRDLNRSNQDFVIDSRMAWHFIETAFRVFLKVEQREAARRIMRDSRRQSEKYRTLEEALESIRSREESEQERYRNLYGVNLYDLNNYHLVVDTTHRSPEETYTLISQHWQRFEAGERFHLVLD